MLPFLPETRQSGIGPIQVIQLAAFVPLPRSHRMISQAEPSSAKVKSSPRNHCNNIHRLPPRCGRFVICEINDPSRVADDVRIGLPAFGVSRDRLNQRLKYLTGVLMDRRVGQRLFGLPHFLSVSLEEGGVRNDGRLVCRFRRLEVTYDLCLSQLRVHKAS